MEYSPSARFVDEPSLAVINRQWGTTEAFTQNRIDGWLEIATERMTIRYKIGSGAFTTDTSSSQLERYDRQSRMETRRPG